MLAANQAGADGHSILLLTSLIDLADAAGLILRL
jgi:hypothetical protein